MLLYCAVCRPMYIGSKEDEHTEFGEEMQEHLEDLLYVRALAISLPTRPLMFVCLVCLSVLGVQC